VIFPLIFWLIYTCFCIYSN